MAAVDDFFWHIYPILNSIQGTGTFVEFSSYKLKITIELSVYEKLLVYYILSTIYIYTIYTIYILSTFILSIFYDFIITSIYNTIL